MVAYQSERSGRGARTRNDAEGQGIVEAEDVLGDEHAENKRHSCSQGSP